MRDPRRLRAVRPAGPRFGGIDCRPMATVEVQGVEGMQAPARADDRPERVAHRHPGGHRHLRRPLRRRPVDPRRRRAGEDREPLRDDDRPRQPDPLAGRRLPQGPDLLDRLRPRRQLRLEQDPLSRPGPGRRQGPRQRRGRLRRRGRRRLVAGRHPLHPRGRGQREALLRRRLGDAGHGARRVAGASDPPAIRPSAFLPCRPRGGPGPCRRRCIRPASDCRSSPWSSRRRPVRSCRALCRSSLRPRRHG